MATYRSDWYTAKSIPISSIPKEDLNEAFYIFANGCQEMINLLWNCYNNGIVTLGNHIKENSYFGYLQIDYRSSNREMLKKMVDYCLDHGNCTISTSYFGNVFSGIDWDSPSISFGPINMLTTEFFGKLNGVFAPNAIVTHHSLTDIIFEMEDLMINNDWPFNPIVSYDDNKTFVFKLDPNRIEPLSEELEKRILNCGMERITDTIIYPKKQKAKVEVKFFGFFDYDETTFTNRVKSVLNHLKNDFSYTKPSPYDETVGFDYKVHLLKQVLLKEGPEGGEKLNEWINSHKWNPDLQDVDYY